MVDITDLKSVAVRRAGSSPAAGTTTMNASFKFVVGVAYPV